MLRALSRRFAAPRLEILEGRTLPAASIAVIDRVLVIDGTDLADQVHVTLDDRGTAGIADDRLVVSLSNALEARTEAFNLFRLSGPYVLPLILRIQFIGRRGCDEFVNNTDYGATADGGEGNDTLVGGGGNDVLRGGIGDDQLRGRGGDDAIDGGADTDRLKASGGSLTLTDTSLTGAEGSDTISGIEKADLGGSAGDDVISAAAFTRGGVQIHGFGDDDTLTGGPGDDELFGDGGIDRVTASGGSFVLTNDLLTGSSTGRDTLEAIEHATLTGSANADVLDASAFTLGGVTLAGAAGNDRLIGSPGDDTLAGGDGSDVLTGSAGNDTLQGDANSDVLAGQEGDDVLCGGDGNDTLAGYEGQDTLRGDAGADLLNGGDGDDSLYGGGGPDTLRGGAGDDGLFGGMDIDTLYGEGGNDRFLDYTWTVTVTTWGGPTLTLRKWQDTLADITAAEARVGFENGSAITTSVAGLDGKASYAAGTWADTDVEWVDYALGVLHHATRNARLLRKEDGGGVVFVRRGNQDGGSLTVDGWNTDGRITMTGDAFSRAEVAQFTTFHEMGHNWDTEYNAATWRALSGWTREDKSDDPNYAKGLDTDVSWYYLKGALFVSPYATTNPEEDFAVSFTDYFMKRGKVPTYHPPVDIDDIPLKKSFFDNMMADLS